MFEKILVPLDGSKLAEIAIPYAIELAGKLSSEITFISVKESRAADAAGHVPEEADRYDWPESAFDIEKYLSTLDVQAKDVKKVCIVGHPAETILDYAAGHGIALIVMSTHGQSGIMRWAIGSVATKVVTYAKQPVMLIKANRIQHTGNKTTIKKIFVPLDGSPESEMVLSPVS